MDRSCSIDLVICTYNNAALLDRTLHAIAAQDVPPDVAWRVLVVDNNCTDETPDVVRRHLREGAIPHLEVVAEPRQGLTYARLSGVHHTDGEWIAFIDDDCLLQADWLAQAARFTRDHPACGAFGGRVVLAWEVPPPPFVPSFAYAYAAQDHGDTAKEVACLAGAGMVVRRAALYGCGWAHRPLLMDRTGTHLISGGDVEIALRLRGAGHALWFTPDCILKHVIPPRRMTKRYLADINYGLGISQVLGDSLLWPGSFPVWCVTSTATAARASYGVALQAARDVRRRRPLTEAQLHGSFARGRWAGIWKLLRMDADQRRALIGCANRAYPASGPHTHHPDDEPALEHLAY